MRIKLNTKIKLNKMVRDEIEKIIKKRIKKQQSKHRVPKLKRKKSRKEIKNKKIAIKIIRTRLNKTIK